MSNNKFVFAGLSELKSDLQHLPETLVGEGVHLVEGAANATAVDVKRDYPVVTGNLRDHVVVDPVQHSAGGVRATVRSTARHAHLFEYGTQARHTSIGANRGAMPPGHIFVPAAQRQRRVMVQQLIELVRSQGLQVHGE
jgi:hypothetical protein